MAIWTVLAELAAVPHPVALRQFERSRLAKRIRD
jgi:hypothetical protein